MLVWSSLISCLQSCLPYQIVMKGFSLCQRRNPGNSVGKAQALHSKHTAAGLIIPRAVLMQFLPWPNIKIINELATYIHILAWMSHPILTPVSLVAHHTIWSVVSQPHRLTLASHDAVPMKFRLISFENANLTNEAGFHELNESDIRAWFQSHTKPLTSEQLRSSLVE